MQKYQAKGNDKESKENKPARPLSAEERNKQAAVKVAGRPVSANEANRAPAGNPVNLAWGAAKQGQADRWASRGLQSGEELYMIGLDEPQGLHFGILHLQVKNESSFQFKK